MVQFAEFTKEERATVMAIVDRAVEEDISAVHFHCPLRLNDLLAADRFNFAHDMCGIQRHINRETGQLENFFLPRFAAPQ